jgi:hypothetical protein
MTDDKWQELADLANKQFKNVKVSTEPLMMDTPDGPVSHGTKDILIFDNPMGRFKLVRENRPVVLDKKLFASHRQGDTARTEYKFSATELSHRLRVYREVDMDEWEEVSADSLGL